MNSDHFRLCPRLTVLLVCMMLGACEAPEPLDIPAPDQVTRDDIGYLCGMIVMDHSGPKSQIFVGNDKESLWFTTVRDGLAFTLLPEETRPIQVFYVTAMDHADWSHPENSDDNWVEADNAWFVIESEKRGSMGAPEAIPFRSEQSAQAFIGKNGGRGVRLADMPHTYILGPG